MTCYAAHTDNQLRTLAPEDPEALAELVRRGLAADPAAVARSKAMRTKAQARYGGHEFFDYNERPRKWSNKTVVR